MAETNEGLGREPTQPHMEEMRRLFPRTELSSVVFPELGKRDDSQNLQPKTEEETLGELNNFLSELNAQGADIVSVFDVDVTLGKRPDKDADVVATRKIAVIRKVKQD